jgi:precorrin-2 methylase
VRRLLLIGIGTGDPDHVTVQAVRALNAFDVLFVVTKEGTDELVALRREIVHGVMASGERVSCGDETLEVLVSRLDNTISMAEELVAHGVN